MAGIYVNIENSGEYSKPGRTESGAIKNYVHALQSEVIFYAETHGSNQIIDSIYFGGAVYLLPSNSLSSLIETVIIQFGADNVQEMAVDISPDTANPTLLRHLQSLGFERINLLAASFFDDDLRNLECTYRSEDIQRTIDVIQQIGFRELALELYYDIEGQPFEYWAAGLEKVVQQDVLHLSLRSHKEHAMIDLPRQMACCFFFPELEEMAKERLGFAMDYLEQAEFEQYVWMEFAREQARCKQYLQHVEQNNILGIGPGAHSFWWHGTSNSKAHRWSNVNNINRYIALLKQRELPIASRSPSNLDSLANEYIMLSIQTVEGIHTEVLETEYGIDLYSEKIDDLAWLEETGWIHPIRNNRIRLTHAGRLNCYHILPKILLENEQR